MPPMLKLGKSDLIDFDAIINLSAPQPAYLNLDIATN